MDLRLSKKDKEILSLIAVYRILTVNQLAAITQRSRQVIRRKLRVFANEELIETRAWGFGKGAGRPEDIIFITERGASLLQKEGILPENTPWIQQKSIDSIAINHDLLANWFYVHLVHVERSIPDLALNPRAPEFLLDNQGKPIDHFDSKIRIKMGEDFIEFIPDGIFTVCHNGTGKSLLFFLEVDMNTESIASQARNANDIRQKILNYQALFRSRHYKRYEKIFDSKFNGFRLLFLVNSPARLASLSRFVQEMPPSDFIWLTNQKKMFSDGLSAEIWVRGGKTGHSPESIIGPNLASQTPVMGNSR